MKIIDEKRSSLDSLIYVFFFLGTLGIVFSLKGMFSDQPMLWLSKPLAWGIIIGFALTLAGLILRLANLVQLSRSIRWIAIAYNFAIPFVTLGVLIGTFQMNAMPSFGAFLNEYSDVITAPALLPWLFTGTLLSDLFLPYRMGELKSHTPTFGSESEKTA
ncbi:MAG: hypothetical protein ACFN4L_03860 [Pauljensenia sp.]|jgi:hypothetical protein|uniref:Uncharacterized protein n=1 Tax=Schaalia odontolytica TaxID=1660 RepID=A0A6N2SH36_9ACTO|nr:hypothetical protein [Actinomyces sp. ph3]MBF0963441.1 hypothetical protein [Actinomyces sp.]MBF0973222.1 hypothetical protein [Actinomyces sp.]MDU5760244.1 hypothetical protein [Actinomyces sp.]